MNQIYKLGTSLGPNLFALKNLEIRSQIVLQLWDSKVNVLKIVITTKWCEGLPSSHICGSVDDARATVVSRQTLPKSSLAGIVGIVNDSSCGFDASLKKFSNNYHPWCGSVVGKWLNWPMNSFLQWSTRWYSIGGPWSSLRLISFCVSWCCSIWNCSMLLQYSSPSQIW
jgi:hypothetical protein